MCFVHVLVEYLNIVMFLNFVLGCNKLGFCELLIHIGWFVQQNLPGGSWGSLYMVAINEQELKIVLTRNVSNYFKLFIWNNFTAEFSLPDVIFYIFPLLRLFLLGDTSPDFQDEWYHRSYV